MAPALCLMNLLSAALPMNWSPASRSMARGHRYHCQALPFLLLVRRAYLACRVHYPYLMPNRLYFR
jgi:hypothetical protein